MRNVLIFAGTTEGRELVEAFDRSGLFCHVCVATEYGSQVLKTSKNITVHTGRLDEDAMKKLIIENDISIIIDATHPYATVVSLTIRKCVEDLLSKEADCKSKHKIEYIRLVREGDSVKEDVLDSDNKVYFYDNVSECAQKLSKLSGKILLTTGSKELGEFTKISSLKERLVVRVIPGVESLDLCYKAGLEGNQIIAMQGPFSTMMNETIIRDYNIEHLVSKESGAAGGVDSKLLAARNLDISFHMVKRPSEIKNNSFLDSNVKYVYSYEEAIDYLETILKVSFNKGKVNIILAGIGPGSISTMTSEVIKAIREADIIFGANRMLNAIDSQFEESRAKKYPFYLTEDILPVLEEESLRRRKNTKAVILFSGDTGFYSGSRKLYDALTVSDAYEVNILPGISCVSMLSARFRVDWTDSSIISLHGVPKEQWIPRLIDSVKYNEKTFFLTSGVNDINLIGELLEKIDSISGKVRIILGYQMSYPDEKIIELTLKECREQKEDGLYTGLIISNSVNNRYLVPVLKDDYFEREKIPMTKEEVRKLSVCKLKIKEKDIIYDIGAGSGSISVQLGVLASNIFVYAFECNPDAVELSRKNVNRAGLHNVKIVEGIAPDTFLDLPAANAAFIGGSRGNLRCILNRLYEINPYMRVVINAVSLETICETKKILEELKISDLEITEVSITSTREVGEYHMLNSNNPVFIFSFEFAG